MEFWIFTIHDLMNTNPLEDISGDYYHTTLGEDGDLITSDALLIPAMVIRNIILLQR
jgi:hypothetical protein